MEDNLSLWMYIYIYRESHQSISDAHESGCDMNKVVLVVRDHSINENCTRRGLKHFWTPALFMWEYFWLFGYVCMYCAWRERVALPIANDIDLCENSFALLSPALSLRTLILYIYWNSVKPWVAKVLAKTFSLAFKLLSRACVINQADRGTSRQFTKFACTRGRLPHALMRCRIANQEITLKL